MTYQEQLKDPLWYNKREEIKLRDLNKCVRCGSRIKLQVHHKYYQSGLRAWDYPDECYETLCECCHNLQHINNKIKVVRQVKIKDNESILLKKKEREDLIQDLILKYKKLIDDFNIKNNNDVFINYNFNSKNINKLKYAKIKIYKKLTDLRIILFGLKVLNIEKLCQKIF